MDVSTLAGMAVVIGALYALGLSLFAWMLRGRGGTLEWALASLCLTCSGPLAALLHGRIPELLVVLVFNALQYMSLALIWLGAVEFSGMRRRLAPVWLGLGAYLLWLSVFWSLGLGLRGRVVGYCLMSAGWCVAVYWIFAHRLPRELRGSGRLVGGVHLLHVAFNVFRAFLPQEGRSMAEILRPGVQGVSLFLESIVIGGAMSFGLIAISVHRLAVELHQAGRRDSLTGLRNRRALVEEGGQVVEGCRRRGNPCALLLLDLDRFKAVNDEHGHAVGDLALQHFAALVSGALDEARVFGRLGGEEFVVVLPGVGTEARAEAERLRCLVASHPVSPGGRPIALTVSIGVAWAQDGDLDLERLLARADEALYLAKDDGRDRVLEAAPASAFRAGAPRRPARL